MSVNTAPTAQEKPARPRQATQTGVKKLRTSHTERGGRSLSRQANSSPPDRKVEFKLKRDDIALQLGLGRSETPQSAITRKALMTLLADTVGPKPADVIQHVRQLVAENKACCEEKKPKALHLYMGLRPGSSSQQCEKAARQAASAWISAELLTGELNDPECEQMLAWMVDALKDYATAYLNAAKAARKTENEAADRSTGDSERVGLTTSTHTQTQTQTQTPSRRRSAPIVVSTLPHTESSRSLVDLDSKSSAEHSEMPSHKRGQKKTTDNLERPAPSSRATATQHKPSEVSTLLTRKKGYGALKSTTATANTSNTKTTTTQTDVKPARKNALAVTVEVFNDVTRKPTPNASAEAGPAVLSNNQAMEDGDVVLARAHERDNLHALLRTGSAQEVGAALERLPAYFYSYFPRSIPGPHMFTLRESVKRFTAQPWQPKLLLTINNMTYASKMAKDHAQTISKAFPLGEGLNDFWWLVRSTHENELRRQAPLFDAWFEKAIQHPDLENDIALQPICGIRSMLHKCAVLKSVCKSDTWTRIYATVQRAHKQQTDSWHLLREQLRSFADVDPKAIVKPGKLLFAFSCTATPASYLTADLELENAHGPKFLENLAIAQHMLRKLNKSMTALTTDPSVTAYDREALQHTQSRLRTVIKRAESLSKEKRRT